LTTHVELSELSRHSEDELIRILGEQLLEGARGAVPRDPRKSAQYARAWLDEWLRENRKRLCAQKMVKRLTDESSAAEIIEAAAILDFMVATVHGPPALTASAILAKRGLRKICGG
jgi:hypothetical protein